MTSPDKNVEAIRQKLLDRSQVGLKKYGTTTERTDIDFVGWLIHLQEELMDAAIYCQAAMNNQSDIATLEQEIKQVRARLARVENDRSDLISGLEKAKEFICGVIEDGDHSGSDNPDEWEIVVNINNSIAIAEGRS